MKVNTTDELFIDAPPGEVQCLLIALDRDASWWPGAKAWSRDGRLRLSLPVFGAHRRTTFSVSIEGVRRDEGFTWWIEGRELRGRGEWWLERFKDGTIVHYFLETEPGPAWGRMSAKVRRHRWAIRLGLNALKDRLESLVR